MQRTLQQNKQLYAISTKIGMSKEQLDEFIYEETDHRVTTSKNLTIEEAQAIINKLNMVAKKYTTVDDLKAEKMRRKIISIAHEMNWRTSHFRADMDRINNFCLTSSATKKDLNKHTVKELPALVTQFEQLLKSFYKNAKG